MGSAKRSKKSKEIEDSRPTPGRADDLQGIKRALKGAVKHSGARSIVAQGDSLALLKKLPDSSVSLILTDPPYHSTRKENIYGDTFFKEDEHFLAWMTDLASEWARILKPNGSAYVFCSPSMSSRLEVSLESHLKPLNHITWTKPNDPGFDGWKGKMRKDALRRWYPHSERILYFEQKSDNPAHRTRLSAFLREIRIQSGMSGHELTAAVGAFGKVNHGGAVSNWETGRNVPSREQYERITSVLEATGKVQPLPPYEDVVRPFQMAAHLNYTDIWTFPSVRPYKGKHPAEKPIEMLSHIIAASTYEGDIVLDCFSGSGATAFAALCLNRRTVSLEIEDQWVVRTLERVFDGERTSPHQSLSSARARRDSLGPQERLDFA
jgi:site-specific DNA-methyltransferase (adenine-specific)